MICPRCDGKGTTETKCTDPQCGDSSWDHACGHGYQRCSLCDGIGSIRLLKCGHPVECYRQHGEHGSSCAWCVDLLRLKQEIEAGEAMEVTVKALQDKVMRFDLDQAGIERREADAVELVELRATRRDLLHALESCREMLRGVERLRRVLLDIADGGCEWTGSDTATRPCYRRSDCDCPCPACRARAALEDREEVTP